MIRSSPTATSSSPASPPTYPSSCSGAVNPNYAISYSAGTVTVNKAPLTITASSPNVTYGTAPTVTAGYSGFVNGDSATSLTTRPTCSTTATSSSPVSPPTYPSSCSGAVDPDYILQLVSGAVTVNQAPLTITASSGSMTYGTSPPAITPIYSGFKNGDNASSLSSSPVCTTTATNSSHVVGSPYPSSCSGAAATNYTVDYVPGAVTVTPAPITIAVSGTQSNGGTPSFGGADSPPPGITVNTSGLMCGQVAPSTAITASLPNGTYTLVASSCSGASLSGAGATDYTPVPTSSSGDFTVSGAPPPPPTTTATATGSTRLLVGRLGRGHLHVRLSRLPRVDRESRTAAPGGRHHPDTGPSGLLARRVRRRHLRLR